jgi:hypothetical protein
VRQKRTTKAWASGTQQEQKPLPPPHVDARLATAALLLAAVVVVMGAIRMALAV